MWYSILQSQRNNLRRFMSLGSSLIIIWWRLCLLDSIRRICSWRWIKGWIVRFGCMIREGGPKRTSLTTHLRSEVSTRPSNSLKTLASRTCTHHRAFHNPLSKCTRSGCRTKPTSNFKSTTTQRNWAHTSKLQNGSKTKASNPYGNWPTTRNPSVSWRYSKRTTTSLMASHNANR